MELVESNLKFDWKEYFAVTSMLALSLMIGLYYTFFKTQLTYKEYMLAGKTMGVFPVSMSLIASFVSGITLIGVPTEIYVYGMQYLASNVAHVIIFFLTCFLYLPVFYKLQLNSVFEYLELRFNRWVRIMGTFLYSFTLVLFLPVVMYVPALAFNQVTGLPTHTITPIICISCMIYTAFGGLRAVLWTDALQNMFMFLAVIFIVILGIRKAGGVQEIWRINKENNRAELFNMDLNPFTRNTFWTVAFGTIFVHLTNIATNPGSVQRFMAVPSLLKARMVLLCSCIGFYAINNLAMYLGLTLYARYHDCDPVAAGVIKNHMQIVPLYVIETGRDYPGLAGLFMAGVLSAALSTMSSWLNTIGGTFYKDVMEVFFPHIEHSELHQSRIIRTIVCVLGIIVVLLVAVVEKLGTVLQVANSLLGIMYGSFLSLFTLGLLFPRVNSKGAITGTLSSLALTGWIVVNAQYCVMQGKLRFPGKVTSIDHCPPSIIEHFHSNSSLLFTHTGKGTPVVADDSVPLIYQLSFHYYIVLGAVFAVAVAILVSLMTDPPDPASLNPDLFSTYVHSFLPHKVQIPRPNRNEYMLRVQSQSGSGI